MNFRNISAWCIRNPVPPIVMFVLLLLAGLVAFSGMQVNNNPDIDFPAVEVDVSQPGAAPAEMEVQVTQRIEAAIRGVNGVEEIDSSVREGSSSTFVQFQIGTPTDRAVNDVRNAIAQIRSNLPDGILEPQVTRIDISGDPIFYAAAETSDMSLEQLSWYVDNDIAKQLLGVSGVAAVDRLGGVDRQIRVILDPAALQAQGITAAQVNSQLRQSNLNAPGGRAEIAGSEQTVRVLGNAPNAYDLGQTQIALPGSRWVKLSDLGEVKDAYSEQRSIAKMNGRQVVSFSVTRAKGSSEVSVYDDAWKALHKIEKDDPRIKFREIINNVDYTKQQYKSAMEGLIEGAVLAVFVVFLFLRDIRATLISAIAIPLSAIPAFWFMSLMGITLNGLSLLALSLVAGVLVDDAIVEIENIVRHMRMGKTAYQAAIDAADEIGLAVLATTMSIVAVFLPVGLMPGVSGQFFKNFGLTVVASVLMSLAVARLLTPMIAAYFLKAKGHAAHGEGRMMNWYMAALRWTLRHRWSSIVAGAVALALTVVFFAILPQSFQPDQDQDASTASIEMVPGTTLAQTQAVVDKVAAILKKQPQVEDVYSRAFVGNGRVTAIFKKDKDLKSVKFERQLAPQLAAIPDARVSFRSQQGWGSSGRDITIVLGGDDPKLLTSTAQTIVQQLSKLKSVTAPRIQGDLQQPELVVSPRFDLAANLGVTTQALSNAVRLATLGDIDQNKAKFSLSDRQVPITVALEQSSRARMATIENIPVSTINGGSVPLSTVADIGFGASPSKIERVQLQRQLTIGADLGLNPKTGKPLVSSEAWKEINALPIMQHLPNGVQQLTLGQAKWQAEMINNFLVAVVAGVFLVFAVLVLLYRRVLPPFVNMGSLLLAPLGGLIALWIAGQPISMPVYIGLLMLIGIVAKNSILLIDFALEEMGKGVPSLAAIEDAGHKRAQPIVMTTVAMVAGMVPTAVSLSGDASWRAPMGIVVIGGLILSTALTLLIVPASFSLAIGVEEWAGPWLRRVLLTYRPGDDSRPILAHPDAPKPIGYDHGEQGPQPAE